MKKYETYFIVTIRSITILSLVSILSLILSNCQALIYSSYIASELFAFAAICGIGLTSIAIICLVYIGLKLYKSKPLTGVCAPLKKLPIIFSITAVFLLIFYIYIFSGGTTVSGYETNIKKYTSNGMFYVILQGKSYKVPESEYNLVCNNTPYLFRIKTKDLFGSTYENVAFLKSDVDNEK